MPRSFDEYFKPAQMERLGLDAVVPDDAFDPETGAYLYDADVIDAAIDKVIEGLKKSPPAAVLTMLATIHDEARTALAITEPSTPDVERDTIAMVIAQRRNLVNTALGFYEELTPEELPTNFRDLALLVDGPLREAVGLIAHLQHAHANTYTSFLHFNANQSLRDGTSVTPVRYRSPGWMPGADLRFARNLESQLERLVKGVVRTTMVDARAAMAPAQSLSSLARHRAVLEAAAYCVTSPDAARFDSGTHQTTPDVILGREVPWAPEKGRPRHDVRAITRLVAINRAERHRINAIDERTGGAASRVAEVLRVVGSFRDTHEVVSNNTQRLVDCGLSEDTVAAWITLHQTHISPAGQLRFVYDPRFNELSQPKVAEACRHLPSAKALEDEGTAYRFTRLKKKPPSLDFNSQTPMLRKGPTGLEGDTENPFSATRRISKTPRQLPDLSGPGQSGPSQGSTPGDGSAPGSEGPSGPGPDDGTPGRGGSGGSPPPKPLKSGPSGAGAGQPPPPEQIRLTNDNGLPGPGPTGEGPAQNRIDPPQRQDNTTPRRPDPPRQPGSLPSARRTRRGSIGVPPSRSVRQATRSPNALPPGVPRRAVGNQTAGGRQTPMTPGPGPTSAARNRSEAVARQLNQALGTNTSSTPPATTPGRARPVPGRTRGPERPAIERPTTGRPTPGSSGATGASGPG